MTREQIVEQLDSIVGTYEILLGNGVNSDILDVDDIEAIKEAISALSKADVRENIHGEWEEVTDYKDDNVYQWHIICSVCRQRGMFESDNFCPNCGADMRGKADETNN